MGIEFEFQKVASPQITTRRVEDLAELTFQLHRFKSQLAALHRDLTRLNSYIDSTAVVLADFELRITALETP